MLMLTGESVVRTARAVEPSAFGHVEHDAQNGQVYRSVVGAVVPAQAVGVEQRTHSGRVDQEPFENRQAAK